MNGGMCHLIIDVILAFDTTIEYLIEDIIGVFLPICWEEGNYVTCFCSRFGILGGKFPIACASDESSRLPIA